MSEPQKLTNINETAAEQTASIQPGGATADFKPVTQSPQSPGERGGAGSNVQVPGYKMLGVLGRGGMGVVYKAVQEKANRLVALKMILAGAHADQHDRTRFHVEAAAAARMSHPNIVQLYEVGETPDGFPFFSLEYIDGGTLADRLKQGPLRPHEAAALVESLARAMQYAHERGIVHRDLKPLNILLEQTGTRQQAAGSQTTMKPGPYARTTGGSSAPSLSGVAGVAHAIPKISDFGLAKQLDSEDGLTRTGAIMGSPAYMAPEQAFGQSKSVGPAADIYALGAILYECLTGRPPFKGATIADTLEQVRTMEPITLKAYAKEIPADLETICLHCLHKEPQRRYASADALAEDLRRYGEGKPITVRPVSDAVVVRWCRRNPGWAGMIGAVAALALLLIAGLAYNNFETRALNAKITEESEEKEKQRKEADKRRKEADEKKLLADARGEQALKAVGLFATDARHYCEDAMVPAESRKKLYEVLIKQLEKQAGQAAGEATIDAFRNKAFLYQTLCAVNVDFGAHKQTMNWYGKGLANVDEWEKLKPRDPTALGFRAALLNLYANSLKSQRMADEAKRLYAESLAIRRELAGDPDIELPGKVDSVAQLADSLDSLEQFEESLALRTKISKMFENDERKYETAKNFAMRGETRERSFPYREALCWSHQKAGLHAADYTTRKKHLLQADKMSAELMRERPTNRNMRLRWALTLKILGELEYNHGILAEKAGKKGEAETYFLAAEAHYRNLNKRSKELATSDELIDGIRDYSRSYYTLGIVEQRKGNPTEARKHFEMSKVIREQAFHDYAGHAASSHLQIDLFFSQLALGELTATMATVQNMEFTLEREPDAQYRLACVYALAINTIEETRKPDPLTDNDKSTQRRYAGHAISCLRSAHDAGFTDFFQSNVDSDLGAIRDDPRMKEFEATHQYQLGLQAKKRGEAAKARVHFAASQDLTQEWMKLLPRDDRRPQVKADWLCAHVQLGKYAAAIEEADKLRQAIKQNAPAFFRLARVYALASAATNDPKLQAQYRTQALEILEQAGNPSINHRTNVVTETRLVNEEDLDPIRGDPRFQAILDAAKKRTN